VLHGFYFKLLGCARSTSLGFDLVTLYAGAPVVDGSALITPFNCKEIKVAV
jgi:hypothetical protein